MLQTQKMVDQTWKGKFRNIHISKSSRVTSMDEGTLKTETPKCRSLLVIFVWGGVAILLVLNLVRNRVWNSQNMVYNTTQHPPTHPPQLHPVSIFCTFSMGGGEVREKVEGQQYTSIVPSSMGATVHKLCRKYQLWVNVSPVYKIC